MSQSSKSRLLRLAAQLGLFGTVTLGGALLVAGPAGATSISAQISQLQAQERSLRGQLGSVQGQASSAGQQAAATQQLVAAAEQRLALGQQQLAQANAALALTNDNLAATQAKIARDSKQLAQLVTQMYQHGNANNLSTAIADSSGVSQFFDTTLQLQSVGQQFTLLTNELSSQEAQLQTLQAQQQVQQHKVAGLVVTLQAAANQLQRQEALYQQQASSLTGRAGQIAGQIQQVSHRIQTLQAEEAALGYSYRGGSATAEGAILRILPTPSDGADLYPWGQCTWYVATQTRVPWAPMGNADQWISEDYSMGSPYAVGSSPRAGSMVVFAPGGVYDPLFGHVAWVVAVVSPSTFIVAEGNFLGLGVVDEREIYSLQGVEGFIYG